MKKIVFLVEGQSEEVFLKELLPRILPEWGKSCICR